MKRTFAIIIAILLSVITLVSAAGEENTDAPLFIGRIKEINSAEGTITVQSQSGYRYTVKAEGFILNEKVSINTATSEVTRIEEEQHTTKKIVLDFAGIFMGIALLFLLFIHFVSPSDFDIKDPLWFVPLIVVGVSFVVGLISVVAM